MFVSSKTHKQEVGNLNKEKEKLSQQLEIVKEELNSLNAEKNELLSTFEIEKNEVSRQQAIIVESQNAVENLKKDKEALLQQLEKSKEETIRIKSEKVELLSTFEKEEKEVSRLKALIDKSQKDLEQLNSKNELYTLNEERKLQLDNSQKEQEEKFNRVKRLIKILKHDLRKHLEIGNRAISKIFRSTQKLTPNMEENLREILFGLDSTMVGIDNISIIAKRIEVNEPPNLTESIIMKDIVKEIFSDLKNIAYHNNVELVENIEKGVVFYGDEFLIKVALSNLILNGIEANERNNEKGKLEITSVDSNDGFYHFYVKNSGTPLDEERFESIFKQEIKSKKGDDRIGEGTILIKGILDIHRGEIEPRNPQSKEYNTSILVKIPKNQITNKL